MFPVSRDLQGTRSVEDLKRGFWNWVFFNTPLSLLIHDNNLDSNPKHMQSH